MKGINEVLIYKRTHIGDPNPAGQFGVNDCMGMVRNRRYDAVIGIGGISAEPRRYRIAGKITWVGIGPRQRTFGSGRRGPVVTFDNFLLLDQFGPLLEHEAPLLAKHMYDTNRRVVMSSSLNPRIRKEIEEILKMAMHPGKTRKAFSFGRRQSGNCRTICKSKPRKQFSSRGLC